MKTITGIALGLWGLSLLKGATTVCATAALTHTGMHYYAYVLGAYFPAAIVLGIAYGVNSED